MLLRRFIGCLMLCMVFVLSSTFAQAMRPVDDWQTSWHQAEQAKLPPCHHAVKDMAPDDHSAGHHGGCSSNFVCCLGLVAEYAVHGLIRSSPLRDVGCERVMRSASPEPLSPPPKLI